MFRRIPLRGQRQGHGEGGAGKAEAQTQQQGLVIAVYADKPGGQQGGNHHQLGEDTGALGRQVISQKAQQQTQYGAGKDRGGDHHAPFLCSQSQIGGNLHRQGAKHVPDHEAQIEVEKGGEQRRCMAGFPE